jgi:hypothetical protein
VFGQPAGGTTSVFGQPSTLGDGKGSAAAAPPIAKQAPTSVFGQPAEGSASSIDVTSVFGSRNGLTDSSTVVTQIPKSLSTVPIVSPTLAPLSPELSSLVTSCPEPFRHVAQAFTESVQKLGNDIEAYQRSIDTIELEFNSSISKLVQKTRGTVTFTLIV